MNSNTQLKHKYHNNRMSREILKKVIQFAKREYREKNPLSIEVLRIKSKPVFVRGILPLLRIDRAELTHFIISTDFGDYLRIYSFTETGELLGAENLEKSPKIQKSLSTNTTLQYHLPKKK